MKDADRRALKKRFWNSIRRSIWDRWAFGGDGGIEKTTRFRRGGNEGA